MPMIKLFFALAACTAAGAAAAMDPNSSAAPVHFITRDFVALVDIVSPLFPVVITPRFGVSVVTISVP